ncbi:hypothetical protein [Gordonia crocea]|uniref:hypothetical protein n=1 Tax=Gordonia crocea TaxID=589162 RepID=UPI00137B3761|nr:hypothetical protein [Gordonia crocea]
MNHDELAAFVTDLADDLVSAADDLPGPTPERGDWIRCHHRRTLTLADHAAA